MKTNNMALYSVLLTIGLAGNLWADPIDLCVQSVQDMAQEVIKRKNAEQIISNNIVTYQWDGGRIQCIADNDRVLDLTVAGDALIIDGVAGVQALDLKKYMTEKSGEFYASCTTRASGLQTVIDQNYAVKLADPNTDIRELKQQFDDNFDMITGDYYVKEFYNNQPRLHRLDAFETLLAGLSPQDIDNPDCVVIANNVLAYETKMAQDFAKITQQIDQLKSELATKDAQIATQSAQIQDLTEKLSHTQGELTKYAGPQQFDQIADLLKNRDFLAAKAVFLDWSKKYLVTNNDLNNLEKIALDATRPIPADQKQLNLDGYIFLTLIAPENSYYQTKLEYYSKSSD